MNKEVEFIGKRIKQIREGIGFTIGELAGKIGFSDSYLSKIENGVVETSLSNLEKILNTLGRSIAEILWTNRQKEKPFVIVTKKEIRNNLIPLPIREPKYYVIGQRVAGEKMSLSFLDLNPGEATANYSSHIEEEWHYIKKGEVHYSFKINEKVQECDLKAGDFVHFRSETPHHVANKGGKPSRLMIIRL